VQFFSRDVQSNGQIDHNFCSQCAEAFRYSTPFPHIVIDDLWDEYFLKILLLKWKKIKFGMAKKIFSGLKRKSI